jgi:hypothetical protein
MIGLAKLYDYEKHSRAKGGFPSSFSKIAFSEKVVAVEYSAPTTGARQKEGRYPWLDYQSLDDFTRKLLWQHAVLESRMN